MLVNVISYDFGYGEKQSLEGCEGMLVQGSARFLDALVEKKGIQEIIDIGYELLGNPIQVVDASYKVLAYTNNVRVDDPNWCEIIERKYLSYDMVSRIDIKEVFSKVKTYKHPFMMKPNKLAFETIQSAIIIDNNIVGCFSILGILKPFSEIDMEIAELLSKVLSLSLQGKKLLRNSKETMYEYFIADLLDGNIEGHDVIEDRLKCLNWNLHDNIYLLAVRKRKNDIDNVSLSTISDSIQNLIVGSKSIVYNNYSVTIISRKKKDFPNESEFKCLTKLLSNNEMYGSISRRFDLLANIGKFYKQCIKAIELGLTLNSQKVLFAYDDYAVDHVLSICLSQENLLDFCHQSLLELEEYDKRYSEQLIRCLFEYLTNNKSIINASNVLGIHRNTLSYRLKKISEITNLDLENNDVCFYLLFSFKIINFIKSKDVSV